MLEGQTTIAPCAWCGEAAESEVTITESKHAKDAMGKDILQKVPLKLPVCHVHAGLHLEGPLKDPRKSKAQDVEQLELMPREDAKPKSALEL